MLKTEAGLGSFVDIGLDRMALVAVEVAPNTRVTLKVGEQPTARFVPEYGETMIMAEVGGGWGERGDRVSTTYQLKSDSTQNPDILHCRWLWSCLNR